MMTEQSLQIPGVNERRRTLDALFHAFLEHTASAGVSIATLMRANPVEPEFDRLCQRLERECAGLRAGLDAMRDIVDLLPVHAVLTRLFPIYRTLMDEQELWNLERVARETYESSLSVGASGNRAYDAAHAACVAAALKPLRGQEDLLDLSDEVCWLIQGVLAQVELLMARRQMMQPCKAHSLMNHGTDR